MSKPVKVGVKEAVNLAIDFFKDVYAQPVGGLLVEEVVSGNTSWLITLGYNRPIAARDSRPGASVGNESFREYKVFEVDKRTGEVESMKIRRVG